VISPPVECAMTVTLAWPSSWILAMAASSS
jgi:hypothetical protein